MTDKDSLLARWMADEISDAEFQKQVTQKDFLSYKKLKEATRLYALTREELPENLWQKIQQNKPKRVRIQQQIYPWAAAVAILFLLFWSVNNYLNPDVFAIETAKDETKTFFLPDHTKITLSPQSKLTYKPENFKHDNTVRLHGKAYFEINRSQPLKIVTDEAELNIRNNKLSVEAFPKFFKTEIYEGKPVIISIQGKHINIKARQSVLSRHNKLFLALTNNNKPDWISNKNHYDTMPLAYILSDLSQKFDIEFVNKGIDEKTFFTGTLVYDNLKLNLKILSTALQFKYRFLDSHTIVLEPK